MLKLCIGRWNYLRRLRTLLGLQRKKSLLDYANRIGAPMEVIENLQELEDEDEIYESIEDIWPDYPDRDDFFFDEEEY